jgi:hypothetical protein
MDYIENLDRYMKELGCYTAENCIPAIYNILRHGGIASRFDGSNTIGLTHHPVQNIEHKKRIWPLPAERIHFCLYSVYAGNHASEGWSPSESNKISVETFRLQEADHYVSRFLEGTEPNFIILITRI